MIEKRYMRCLGRYRGDELIPCGRWQLKPGDQWEEPDSILLPKLRSAGYEEVGHGLCLECLEAVRAGLGLAIEEVGGE